jgi:hypothetical protein
MINIKFSSNWNGKLAPDVMIMSTIRRHNLIYSEGLSVELFLKDVRVGSGFIKMCLTLPFGEMNLNSIMMDTGYGYVESRKIFSNFFRCTNEELDKELINYIVIQKYKIK